MFRGFNLRMKFDPKDGMEVLARGRLTVYEPRGELSTYRRGDFNRRASAQPNSRCGNSRKNCSPKGYFDPQRKRPLPRFPRRVGLVASATGRPSAT